MRAQFPFLYKAEFIYNRKRTQETDWFIGNVDVDIPDIAKTEMVPVISWSDPLIEAQGRIEYGRTVFYLDGGFYAPAVNNPYSPVSAFSVDILSPEGLATDRVRDSGAIIGGLSNMLGLEITADSGYSELVSYVEGRKSTSKPPIGDRHTRVATWIDSDHDLAYQKASGIASGLVSMGGALYRKVETPVFVLHQNADEYADAHANIHLEGTRFGSHITLNQVRYVIDPTRTTLMPLERFDEFVEKAAAQGSRLADFELHAPELAAFDMSANMVERTADFIVSAYQPSIGHYRRDAADAWFEIRDRMETHWQTDEPADTSDLALRLLPEFLSKTGGRQPQLDAVVARSLELCDEGTINTLRLGL
jgi:hypothetical protein